MVTGHFDPGQKDHHFAYDKLLCDKRPLLYQNPYLEVQ